VIFLQWRVASVQNDFGALIRTAVVESIGSSELSPPGEN
jgi:hypothetical protein